VQEDENAFKAIRSGGGEVPALYEAMAMRSWSFQWTKAGRM
jgi:hypothetical protein